MPNRNLATVFGGSGFIGRYVVQRLARKGFIVRVAVREPASALFLKTSGAVGQIVPLAGPVTNDADVNRCVEGAEVVINLVGILAERRKGAFQHIHVEGARRIARLAAANGVTRLVHLSAIGADPNSPSRYGHTKAEGEAAVRDAFPAATILRPSIVFGQEDHFFNRFARIAQISPVMPVIAGATRFQPVYVGDVADAVMASLARADTAGMLYELGGPRVWTFREILAYILQETQRRRPMLNVPMGLARLQAMFGELLPWKPLTRDQLLMLQRDNVVAAGALSLPDLGIIPTPLEMVVPAYIRRFGPGGGRRVFPQTGKGAGSDLSFGAG